MVIHVALLLDTLLYKTSLKEHDPEKWQTHAPAMEMQTRQKMRLGSCQELNSNEMLRLMKMFP